jgi:hypothetical protein
MSRRLIALVTIVCATALSASTVALAHGGGSGGHRGDGGAKRHHVVRAGGLWGTSLDGLAQRLGVSTADLQAAVKAVAADQRAARQADPSAPKPDLAAKKAAWIDGLAAKLSKTPDEVAAAVRAELDARLTDAVSKGWLTEQGRTLALGCFDNPASCDLKALRAEVRGGGRGDRHGGKRHHGPCPNKDKGDDNGSTTSRPGGRQTSAPLT